MNINDKELFDEKIKGVLAHQQANFDILNLSMEKILTQVTMTNGRVTALEKCTKVVRFFEGHPKFAILLFLGVVFIFTFFDLKDLIEFIKP